MKKQFARYNRAKKALVVAMALVFGFGGMYQFVKAAAPSNIITYQGRLLNANGVPVSDASVDITFTIYDALTGGNCLWSNSSSTCVTTTARSVTLTDGLFSENLGDTGDSYEGITSTVFGDNAETYLEIIIEGETLSPRKRITAAPYASNADMLDGLSSASFFQLTGDNTVTGANDFTGATFTGTNAFVFEGSSDDDNETIFAITNPLDGDNTITFKDQTGTVAFLNDIPWTNNGAVLYLTEDEHQVAIGGTDPPASEFGFVPASGIFYLGDGSTTNGSITFKASDADSGTLTYTTDDLWLFDGGNISHTGNAVYTASPGITSVLKTSGTASSGASGGAGSYLIELIDAELGNTASQGGSIQQELIALSGLSTNSSTGQVDELYGVKGVAQTSSTDASAVGTGVYGVYGSSESSASGVTVPLGIGVYARGLASNSATVTTLKGLYSEVVSSASGGATTSYGGDFVNTTTGTTRYGLRSGASGGTANYSGYFYGSAVHVDSTASPSSPNIARGAGDLYVYDQVEIDGTNQTDSTIFDITTDDLTTGTALAITRSNNAGSDFSNSTGGLVDIRVTDAASAGDALYIAHTGVGNALSINQLGDAKALIVESTGTTDYLARFFNNGNADTNMGLEIQACLDTDPTASCDYIVFKDGNGTVLGAIEGNGTGGVTNASTGSDYAELFNGVLADFEQGDVIGFDATGEVVLAGEADEMIGAYSVAPNTLGNWFDGWRDTEAYVPVALIGQVPVAVNMEGGAIAPGDYLTLSSVPGVAKKATGVGYVLGQALESHTSGEAMIEVYIKPTWQAVGVLTDAGSFTEVSDDLGLSAMGVANATDQGVDSYGLMLRGSGWNGASAESVGVELLAEVTDATAYQLSFNDLSGGNLAFINQDGDFALSGRLFPSDRGVLQTDKYIYYDGSSGLGGDFMRTNASGWGSGSYDFAEMFQTTDPVVAGEVVVFAQDNESVTRSTGVTYDDKIAGIVSTQPGFLAGENASGHVPVALAGRVPTFVSGENGAIDIGDPLTTASKPGYAMKATESGPIVGYAMEAFSEDVGSIIAFVRASYYDGDQEDLSENTLTERIPSSSLDLSGIVNLNGGSLLSVSAMSGIGKIWSIDADGAFRTQDRFVQEIETYSGDVVETYAITSTQTTLQLSGTIELEQGRAHVFFDEYDEVFEDIISLTAPYRVYITAHEETGSLYAMNRERDGFIIRDTQGASNVLVDWLVIAYHKDFEPEEEVVEDVISNEQDKESDTSQDDNEGDQDSEEIDEQEAYAEDIDAEVADEESSEGEVDDQEEEQEQEEEEEEEQEGSQEGESQENLGEFEEGGLFDGIEESEQDGSDEANDEYVVSEDEEGDNPEVSADPAVAEDASETGGVPVNVQESAEEEDPTEESHDNEVQQESLEE